MGTRKHFNPNRICSSENYRASRKAHQDFIRRQHEENIVEIQEISECISIRKKCYVSCFGKLVEITEVEAAKVSTIKIIKK